MDIKNKTDLDLTRIMVFVGAEMERYGYQHDNLTIRFNCSKRKPWMDGRCCYPMKASRRSGRRIIDRRGIFTIHCILGNPLVQHSRYPRNYEMYIGAKHGARKFCRGYETLKDLLVWQYDSMFFDTETTELVWLIFHELWHFICASKQDRGNTQSGANRFAFKETRRFLQEEYSGK